MAPHPVLVHAALILVSVLFGFNYVCTHGVVEAVEPRAWVYIRVLSAMILLWPVVLWQRRGERAKGNGKVPWRWLVLATVFGVCLNQILFTEGMARTTPAHGSVINTSIPVLTLLIAAGVRQEALTRSKVLAILVALVGVLTLLEADKLLRSESLGDFWVGDLLTLGNAASFSAFVVIMRHISQRVHPGSATLICFVFACGLLLPWCATALTVANLRAVLQPGILGQALFVVIGATVLTYLLNNWALRHARSSLVVLYIYLQPIVATAVQIIRGKEQMGPRFWVAMLLVFAGILLASADGWLGKVRRKT